jgi:phosphatidylglycerol:prolipoprotein diacylglycerol transferase
MIFPRADPAVPRHPSQLYQAGFEGILLFLLVLAVWRWTDGRRRPGLITGVFCMGYAVARIVGELFREPDSFLGFIAGGWLTMGMLLSLPVLAFGAWLAVRAYRNPPATTP